MVNGIELDALTVGYSSKVIENVSLNIEAGDIVALIGPNGAGKSTLLKTITRQLKKLDGSIYICGTDDNELTEQKLSEKLSMVMTERIHPELMSCFEVVATGRYPYTGRMGILSKSDMEKINQSIELVGAQEVADKDFMKVSDGQRQRVMLARAICQEPQIMILDEPTSFLDISFKIDILSVIKRLAKERNIAVLMSIHELEFVPAIADKVVAVGNKRVVACGTASEIFTGDIIHEIYGMNKEAGEIIVDGILKYADALKRIMLCQK